MRFTKSLCFLGSASLRSVKSYGMFRKYKTSTDYVPNYHAPPSGLNYRLRTYVAVTSTVVFSTILAYSVYQRHINPANWPSEKYYYSYPKSARRADLGWPDSPSIREQKRKEHLPGGLLKEVQPHVHNH